jgi:hypothetical protein
MDVGTLDMVFFGFTGFGLLVLLDLVFWSYWILVLRSYWILVLRSYWIWFFGLTGFGSSDLLDLVLRTYWILVLRTYWILVLRTYWILVLRTYWILVLRTYWTWLIRNTGFSGFYDWILLLSLMMTQRLSIKTRDYNLFDNGPCFFDFWTNYADRRSDDIDPLNYFSPVGLADR